MNKLKFLSDDFLEEMVKISTLFAGGIYINYDHTKSVESCHIHPCGWDFLSFENIEIDDEKSIEEAQDYDYSVFNYVFETEDISNGIYEKHPLEGYTLKEILKIIGEKGWAFEEF